jgi:hypothetical protein
MNNLNLKRAERVDVAKNASGYRALGLCSAEGMICPMSDQWEIYIKMVDDKPASFFLDVGIAREAPKEDYRVHLIVQVMQKESREDGLTTGDEQQRLLQLEDALEPAVTGWGAIYVGRITTNGRRDFSFYAASADGFDHVVSQALAPFGYDFDTADKPDAGWTYYFSVLYPTRNDWQTIKNRHVLDQLKKGGDLLSKPRRVFHWLYFAAPEQRDQCVREAGEFGFDHILLPPDERPTTTHRYGLELHRVDSVAFNDINRLTIELVGLAERYRGTYDGWETQTVKGDAEPIDDAPKE